MPTYYVDVENASGKRFDPTHSKRQKCNVNTYGTYAENASGIRFNPMHSKRQNALGMHMAPTPKMTQHALVRCIVQLELNVDNTQVLTCVST